MQFWSCILILSVSFLMSAAERVQNDDICTCNYTSSNEQLDVKCKQPLPSSYTQCFSRYKHAQILVFQHSSLTNVPNGLNTLHDLRQLDLSYNNLTHIDFHNFSSVCKNITYLNLDFNNIQTMTNGSLDCFKSLMYISMRNNSLYLIENGTFKANKLLEMRSITLIYNNLKVLDTSLIFFLNTLKSSLSIHVNLSWNDISEFTNSIDLTIDDIFPNYEIGVSLLHNNFTTINAPGLFDLLNVKYTGQLYRFNSSGFDLRFNPFVCDCKLYPFASLLHKFYHMDADNPLFAITCYKPDALNSKLIRNVSKTDFNCSVHTDCPDGCSCINTVALNATNIHCSDEYDVNYLPRKIPIAHEVGLFVNSDRLSTLSSRDYFNGTVVTLDVSGSAVEHIEPDLIRQFDTLQNVYLNDNSIRTLPRDITKLQLNKLKALALYGNPFVCDCHTLWFKHWLLSKKVISIISHKERIICIPTGKALLEVPDSDFRCIHSMTRDEILAVTFSCAFVLIIVIVLIFHSRSTIHILLLRYLSAKLFRKKCQTSAGYRIFASHSSADDETVMPIIDKLRNHIPPYNVITDECFRAGIPITENILNAIESSHTTLIFLSNNFLRSKWCLAEFRESHTRYFRDRTVHLAVVVLGDLDEDLMDKDLKTYIRTHNVVFHNKNYFWERLLIALPIGTLNKGSETSPLMISAG